MCKSRRGVRGQNGHRELNLDMFLSKLWTEIESDRIEILAPTLYRVFVRMPIESTPEQVVLSNHDMENIELVAHVRGYSKGVVNVDDVYYGAWYKMCKGRGYIYEVRFLVDDT